ncbi:hypothetical protein [Natrinema sp. 1APR25-10V2]|uniref:hypothetical protein n=1 Tax=Natrinema sp. 1APR25-10V2 TaxID=2951081 RepID=UPI002875ABB3|nr:hypothetical protein [Natrinema sp. 1APR25-10V2]MDS0475712.1 hypothetical protein [Natrinema sp. 1APR25-10V2]
MSIALTHFAVGATGATLLLAYLPVQTRYDAPLIIASGGWALVPDVWRVLPLYRGTIRALSNSALSNVFWLHSVLDRADLRDSSRLAAVAVGVYLLVALLYAERRRDGPVVAWMGAQGD